MSNVYEALRRAREDAVSPETPRPAVSRTKPALIEAEPRPKPNSIKRHGDRSSRILLIGTLISAGTLPVTLGVIGVLLWGHLDRASEGPPPVAMPAVAEIAAAAPPPPIAEAQAASTDTSPTLRQDPLPVKPDPASPSPAKPRTPAEREAGDRLIAQGDALLIAGDFAASRLFYLQALRAGSPKAARDIARTYDPGVLKGLGVIGAHGDAGKAAEWYQKAVELEGEDTNRER